MADLFLSYDHDDVARAAPIATALEKAGHSVWWDRRIKGGAEYNDEIEAAVEKADAVIVLWSHRSVRSAWVRDEAAEGRERGKLVPVLIDPIKPPMGFRQFQAIDFSHGKAGLRSSSLKELLEAIDALGRGTSQRHSPPPVKRPRSFRGVSGRSALGVCAFAVLAVLAFLAWNWRQPRLAVVSVAAADSAPGSLALSRDLVVKLGTLAQVGDSKWQLASTGSSSSGSDLAFQVADTGTGTKPKASLLLLNGKHNSVLWSREFEPPIGNEADLRLQLSLTAGRVLGCALEARATSGLRPDLMKLFLAGCAEEAETSNLEPHKTATIMRTIVNQEPRFKPAWSRLLQAESQEIGLARLGGSELSEAKKTLEDDIKRARKVVPDLRELKLIDLGSEPPPLTDYAGGLEFVARQKAVAPGMAILWREEASALTGVGRMYEAIESARRATELDPLSPVAMSDLISTLAWAGRIEQAKEELRRAERQWPGTGAVRDAQWAFHSRYGDTKFALTLRPPSPTDRYWRARLEPTPANVRAVVADIQRSPARSEFDQFGYAIQALGEFDRKEEAFAWLSRTPVSKVAEFSYVLFRPGLSEVRRDPRFMLVAKRIGLLSYWRNSDRWPDFCSEEDLPYDCKEEAAKIGV